MKLFHGPHEITDVESWLAHAPPKGKENHWVDGRSAKELARAWCALADRPDVPPEVRRLLDSNPATAQMVVGEMFPEHLVAFDEWPGGVRNADLMGTGRTVDGESVAVSVEGKADEPFDSNISEIRRRADRLTTKGKNTNAVARVDGLLKALFGEKSPLSSYDHFRYQLLTGVAGTLAYATHCGASLAVFIVHEFVSPLARPKALERNAADLSVFVKTLTGSSLGSEQAGILLGPATLPRSRLFPNPAKLFIGKAARAVA